MLQSKDTWSNPYQEGLPNSLFQENRAKFLKDMSHALGFASLEESKVNAIAFFKGVTDIPVYNSDINYPFH